MSYNIFFLLSPHSRLGLFHPYVVVMLSLGFSSNSGSILRGVDNHDYVHVSMYTDYIYLLTHDQSHECVQIFLINSNNSVTR